MLSAHFSDLNRSVIRNSENTSDNSGDVQTFKDKVTCKRNDRHYSALVYASYTGQFECFKAIFEHALEYEARYENRNELVQTWLGSEKE